jgi:Ca2+-binding RTX toxin-like protein
MTIQIKLPALNSSFLLGIDWGFGFAHFSIPIDTLRELTGIFGRPSSHTRKMGVYGESDFFGTDIFGQPSDEYAVLPKVTTTFTGDYDWSTGSYAAAVGVEWKAQDNIAQKFMLDRGWIKGITPSNTTNGIEANFSHVVTNPVGGVVGSGSIVKDTYVLQRYRTNPMIRDRVKKRVDQSTGRKVDWKWVKGRIFGSLRFGGPAAHATTLANLGLAGQSINVSQTVLTALQIGHATTIMLNAAKNSAQPSSLANLGDFMEAKLTGRLLFVTPPFIGPVGVTFGATLGGSMKAIVDGKGKLEVFAGTDSAWSKDLDVKADEKPVFEADINELAQNLSRMLRGMGDHSLGNISNLVTEKTQQFLADVAETTQETFTQINQILSSEIFHANVAINLTSKEQTSVYASIAQQSWSIYVASVYTYNNNTSPAHLRYASPNGRTQFIADIVDAVDAKNGLGAAGVLYHLFKEHKSSTFYTSDLYSRQNARADRAFRGVTLFDPFDTVISLLTIYKAPNTFVHADRVNGLKQRIEFTLKEHFLFSLLYSMLPLEAGEPLGNRFSLDKLLDTLLVPDNNIASYALKTYILRSGDPYKLMAKATARYHSGSALFRSHSNELFSGDHSNSLASQESEYRGFGVVIGLLERIFRAPGTYRTADGASLKERDFKIQADLIEKYYATRKLDDIINQDYMPRLRAYFVSQFTTKYPNATAAQILLYQSNLQPRVDAEVTQLLEVAAKHMLMQGFNINLGSALLSARIQILIDNNFVVYPGTASQQEDNLKFQAILAKPFYNSILASQDVGDWYASLGVSDSIIGSSINSMFYDGTEGDFGNQNLDSPEIELNLDGPEDIADLVSEVDDLFADYQGEAQTIIQGLQAIAINDEYSASQIASAVLSAFNGFDIPSEDKADILSNVPNLQEGIFQLIVEQVEALAEPSITTIARYIRGQLTLAGFPANIYKEVVDSIVDELVLRGEVTKAPLIAAFEAIGYFGEGAVLAPRQLSGTPSSFYIVRSQLAELLGQGPWNDRAVLATKLNAYTGRSDVSVAARARQLGVVYKTNKVDAATAEFLSTNVLWIKEGIVATLRGDIAGLTSSYTDGQIARFVRSMLNSLGFNAAGRLDVLNRVFNNDTLVDATRRAAIMAAVQAADTLDGRDQQNDWEVAQSFLTAIAGQLRNFPNMAELLRAVDIASKGLSLLEGVAGVINQTALGADKLRSALEFFAGQPGAIGDIAKGAQTISAIYEAIQKTYNVVFKGEGDITTGFDAVLSRLKSTGVLDAGTADTLMRINTAAGAVIGIKNSFGADKGELIPYGELKNLIKSLFTGADQVRVAGYLNGVESVYKAIQSGFNAINGEKISTAPGGGWEGFLAAGLNLLSNPTLFNTEFISGVNTVAAGYKVIQNTFNIFANDPEAAKNAINAIAGNARLRGLIGEDGLRMLQASRVVYETIERSINWVNNEKSLRDPALASAAGDRLLSSIGELSSLAILDRGITTPLATVAYGYRAVQSAINAVSALTNGSGAVLAIPLAPASSWSVAANELSNVTSAVRGLATLNLFDSATTKTLGDIANATEATRLVVSFIDKPSLAGGFSLASLAFSSGLIKDPKISYALNVANVALAANPIGLILLGYDLVSRILASGWRQSSEVYRSNIDLDRDYQEDDTVMLDRAVHTDFWGDVTYHNGGYSYNIQTPAPSLLQSGAVSVVEQDWTIVRYVSMTGFRGSAEIKYALVKATAISPPDPDLDYSGYPYFGAMHSTRLDAARQQGLLIDGIVSVDRNANWEPLGIYFTTKQSGSTPPVVISLNGTLTILDNGNGEPWEAYDGMVGRVNRFIADVKFEQINPITSSVRVQQTAQGAWGMGTYLLPGGEVITNAQATALKLAIGSSSATLLSGDSRLSGTSALAKWFAGLKPSFSTYQIPYIYYYKDVNGDGISDLIREQANARGIDSNGLPAHLRANGFLGATATPAAIRDSVIQVTLLDKEGKALTHSVNAATDVELNDKLKLAGMLMAWGASHPELWGRVLQGLTGAQVKASVEKYVPDLDLFYSLAVESGAIKLMRKASDVYAELGRTGAAAPTELRSRELYATLGSINFALGASFDARAYLTLAAESAAHRLPVLNAILGLPMVAAMTAFISNPVTTTAAQKILIKDAVGVTIFNAASAVGVTAAQRKSAIESALFARVDAIEVTEHFLRIGNALGLKVNSNNDVLPKWDPTSVINASAALVADQAAAERLYAQWVQTLGLAAANAKLQTYADINSGWGSVSYVITATNEIQTSTRTLLDGTKQITYFDAAKTQAWNWYQDSISAAGKRTAQTGAFDSGLSWAVSLRVGTMPATSVPLVGVIAADANNLQLLGSADVSSLLVTRADKTSRLDEFDATGKLDKRTEESLNGTQVATLFNDLLKPTLETTVNESTGLKIVKTFNAANQVELETETVLRLGEVKTVRTVQRMSDGTFTVTKNDAFNNASWASTEQHLAADNATVLSTRTQTDAGKVTYTTSVTGYTNGTAGDDTLFGASTAASWIYLYGRNGNDTYLYSTDTEYVYIGSVSEGAATGTADKVVFTDLTLADIKVDYYDYGASSAEGNSLRLLWTKNGKSGELRIANEANSIESYVFADGSEIRSIRKDIYDRTIVSGTSGADYLVGSVSADAKPVLVYGGAGDDTLEIGTGKTGVTNYLIGQTGNDTYIYHAVEGVTHIYSASETATSGTADKVVFADLKLEEMTVSYIDAVAGSAEGKILSFIWNRNGLTGELRISNEGNFIESYEFSDGSIVRDILVRSPDVLTLYGTATQDRIIGNAGAIVAAGAGDDTLEIGEGKVGVVSYLMGQAGNDTYVYRAFQGITSIYSGSENATTGTADKVVFADLNLADLTVSYIDAVAGSAEGRILKFTWAKDGISGELRIANEGNNIESYQFADGSAVKDIVVRVTDRLNLYGTADDDRIVGNAGASVVGGAGNDILSIGENEAGVNHILYGQTGNDTYIYNKVRGVTYINSVSETVTSGAADKVIFADLKLSEVVVDYIEAIANSPEGRVLQFKWTSNGQTGELRISNDGGNIESYEFADGSVLKNIVVRTTDRLDLYGTAGAERIIGGAGARIVAGAGDDTIGIGENDAGANHYLYGQTGNDTYIYKMVQGVTFINSVAENALSGTADRVVFSDLTLAEMTVDVIEGGAVEGKILQFKWAKNGQAGELRISNEGSFIESYEFSDGSVVNDIVYRAADLLTLRGTTASDNIIGNAGAYIVGGTGDDVLQLGEGKVGVTGYLLGQAGNDTYVYRAIQGITTINSLSENATTGTADKVVFADLNLAEMTVRSIPGSTVEGNILQFTWSKNGQTGELRISNEGNFIESYEFADGSSLKDIVVRADDILTLYGTANADHIIGNAGAIVSGLAGDDVLEMGEGKVGVTGYLYGGVGNDTYVYKAVQGLTFITSGSETATSGMADRVVFADLKLSEVNISYYDYGVNSAEGKSIRFTWSKDGKTGELRISKEADNIEFFEFADNVVLKVAASTAQTLTITGTSKSDPTLKVASYFDVGNVAGHKQYANFTNQANKIIKQTGVMDNGNEWQWDWENGFGVAGPSVRTDWDTIGVSPWWSNTKTFDTLGRFTRNELVNDDKSKVVDTFYYETNTPWSKLTQIFNTSGDLVSSSYTPK